MVEKSIFGTLADGTAIDLYKITNKSGAFVTLQTLGAGIQSINVPDKNGVLADVVLGFDNPQDYTNPDLGYQGLVVGRWANRRIHNTDESGTVDTPWRRTLQFYTLGC